MIDAHHHLWRYRPSEFEWIDGSMSKLQRDHLADEFVRTMRCAGVAGSVVVQARQTVSETEWLLEIAKNVPEILGVVGWLPLRDSNLKALLSTARQNHLLKGLRHVVQDEPSDDFLLDPDFNRGMEFLTEGHLTFDLLVRESQLPATNVFVRRFPGIPFVLDHLAKPDIRTGKGFDSWRGQLLHLGECPNVSCKLSGLATEARWNEWTLEDLKPFLDAALEAFGTERLMAGSDWPVCLLATGYDRWWNTLQQWCAPFESSTRAKILGLNALHFYTLAQPVAEHIDLRERLSHE